MSVSPTSLHALLEAVRASENLWLSLLSGTWMPNSELALEVVIHDESGELEPSYWSIRCTKVLEYTISNRGHGALNHVTDESHPLLRQYIERWTTLYFRGVPQNVSAVIGDLWRAHRDECEDWVNFGAYFNDKLALEKLLAGGHGVLADGPHFLLDRYAKVLGGYDVEAYKVGDKLPSIRWSGGYMTENPPHPVALQFGNSSVVALSFEATRRADS